MSLKPPATPRPGIGGGAEDGDLGVLDLAAPTLAQLGHDRRVAAGRDSCRSSNGSRTTNIEPKLELLACSRNDMPAMATVCATPGVSRAIFSTCASDVLGALERGRVGQLDVDDEPALVLLRDEAGRGAASNDPVGQDQQAAVDRAGRPALSRSSSRPTDPGVQPSVADVEDRG